MKSVNAGMWVKVKYEDEVFLGKVLLIKNHQAQVRCLQKPFGVREPQEFEREEDAVFYVTVFSCDVQPEMVKVGRKWLWRY